MKVAAILGGAGALAACLVWAIAMTQTLPGPDDPTEVEALQECVTALEEQLAGLVDLHGVDMERLAEQEKARDERHKLSVRIMADALYANLDPSECQQ